MNSYNGFPGELRDKAQRWLVQKWTNGEVPRPKKCCACGQRHGIIDAHAEDYSEPFGPHIYRFPLCFRCHITLHCRFRSPEGWKRYVELVRAGWVWPAIFKRNFGVIQTFLAGAGEGPTTCGRPRAPLIFDTMFDHNIRGSAPASPSKPDNQAVLQL